MVLMVTSVTVVAPKECRRGSTGRNHFDLFALLALLLCYIEVKVAKITKNAQNNILMN